MEASKASEVYRYTASRLSHILHMTNDGQQKALLAELRRGIGREPGELPELWGMFLEELPESLYGDKWGASPAEWAVYMSLTLFALHQQGWSPQSEPMHKEDVSLGAAAAALIDTEDDFERILRRFNAVTASHDRSALAQYLRGLVQLLRGKGIPLDYAVLARDLYWSCFTESWDRVRLSWGRDFYRSYHKMHKRTEEEQKNV